MLWTRLRHSYTGAHTKLNVDSSHTPTLGAVILAGGLARRMGGNDKGLIEVGQRPMVAWALEAVRPVANSVVINANRNQLAYEKHGVPVIGDVLPEYPGPLAGLLSACECMGTDWVLMCPCDSPFVKPELFNALWAAAVDEPIATENPIVVAHDGERLQPVFAAIKRSLALSLRDYLVRGERKIDRWYDEQGYKSVDCAAYRTMFDNINTPEEQQDAEQRLSRS